MQDAPGMDWFTRFSLNDLREDLVTKVRDLRIRQRPELAGFLADDETFLENSGFFPKNPQRNSGGVAATALLLLGKEDALAAAFPGLVTQVVLRDIERGTEKVRVLPRNIQACLGSLDLFVRSELGGGANENLESPSRAMLFSWFLEMAIFRDYSYLKPARFVIDREYLFLEYPRMLDHSIDHASSTETRYRRNRVIESFLKSVPLTMQDGETAPTQSPLAGKPTGINPIRFEGRLFKVISKKPDFSRDPGDLEKSMGSRVGSISKEDRPGNHASLQGVLHTNKLEESESMQVLHGDENTMQDEVTQAVAMQAPQLSPETTQNSLKKAHIFGPEPRQTERVRLVTADRPKILEKAEMADRTAKTEKTERIEKILQFCQTPRYREEIQHHVGMNNRDHFRKEILNRLIEQGRLNQTLPDKPNSPKQQYVTAAR